MRRVKTFVLASLFGLALSAAGPAFSQSLTGTITGRALDSSGAVLPGVEVAVSSPSMIGGAALGLHRRARRVSRHPTAVRRIPGQLQARRLQDAERRGDQGRRRRHDDDQRHAAGRQRCPKK